VRERKPWKHGIGARLLRLSSGEEYVEMLEKLDRKIRAWLETLPATGNRVDQPGGDGLAFPTKD